jgi:zinc/manganese transport system substrate-binding protein
MVADFSARDPRSAVVFRTNARTFERRDLATFNGLVRQIRARYHGVAVGASESIFAMLAPSLGLNLITPPTFLRAISEGSDVTASDVSTIDRQIAKHKIAIYVDNVQNATPDVAAQIALCRADHVPIATITETLVPQTATFELWQVNELRGILAALERSGVR